jgi:hypothetical protein
MTTIKQIVILLLLASLTFACKKKNEDPTIFEGKVVYADDNSPVAGVQINIIPSLKTTPLTGAKSGDTKKALTKEEGGFEIKYSYNKEFKYFAMIVITSAGSDDYKTINPGNGLDCAPYDCFNFKPHQNYNNLVIKIPRP